MPTVGKFSHSNSPKRLFRFWLAALPIIGAALALSACLPSTEKKSGTEVGDKADESPGFEPILVGDTLEMVFQKAGRDPTGELKRNGVHHIMFGESSIRLEEGRVIYVDPDFAAGPEDSTAQNTARKSISRVVERNTIVRSAQVSQPVINNNQTVNVVSGSSGYNRGRVRYANPGKVTVVCGTADDNFLERVQYLCRTYSNVVCEYGGRSSSATVYDQYGTRISPSTSNLDDLRRGIREGLDDL